MNATKNLRMSHEHAPAPRRLTAPLSFEFNENSCSDPSRIIADIGGNCGVALAEESITGLYRDLRNTIIYNVGWRLETR